MKEVKPHVIRPETTSNTVYASNMSRFSQTGNQIWQRTQIKLFFHSFFWPRFICLCCLIEFCSCSCSTSNQIFQRVWTFRVTVKLFVFEFMRNCTYPGHSEDQVSRGLGPQSSGAVRLHFSRQNYLKYLQSELFITLISKINAPIWHWRCPSVWNDFNH